MTDITDFISASVNEKPMAAQKAFADAMSQRVDAAIQDKYTEVATSVFNPQDSETVEAAAVDIDTEQTEPNLETEMEEDNHV